MKFIDEAFSYLEKEVPDYKDKKYYSNRGKLRAFIEKNKTGKLIAASLLTERVYASAGMVSSRMNTKPVSAGPSVTLQAFPLTSES